MRTEWRGCICRRFNTQPPEGGCPENCGRSCGCEVSTHSRPKAADSCLCKSIGVAIVSTHSRPKAAAASCCATKAHCKFQHTAARRRLLSVVSALRLRGCFNTQPPEGGWSAVYQAGKAVRVSTHSRPKAAAAPVKDEERDLWFQHTAARRRLHAPKNKTAETKSFNTQPPEGG